MIKTRIGGYSASEPPPPSTSSTPYLENIAIGSSVYGGGRFIRRLAFFFGDVEVDGRGLGSPWPLLPVEDVGAVPALLALGGGDGLVVFPGFVLSCFL